MNNLLQKLSVSLAAVFIILFSDLSYGYPTGVSGYTLKGSTPGCTCHTSSPSSSVTLTITGPTSLNTGQTGYYSVQMTYTSTISKGGMDIATSDGTLLNSDSRLKVLNGELTHPSAQVGTTTLTWNFKYTAPSTPGSQTLYATGCGVKSSWNYAPNFTVNVTPVVPVELISFSYALKKNEVNLSWVTATERNNRGFEIQRKNSGSLSEWGTIGFVTGTGTSTEPNHYSFTEKGIESGKYLFRLKQVDFDGNFIYSKSVEVKIDAPDAFAVMQNYPNPFNPGTIISYQLKSEAKIKLKIMDLLGKEIAVLVNEEKTAGSYKVNFDAARYNLASGIYYYTLESQSSEGNFITTRKMILLK